MLVARWSIVVGGTDVGLLAMKMASFVWMLSGGADLQPNSVGWRARILSQKAHSTYHSFSRVRTSAGRRRRSGAAAQREFDT